MGNTDFTLFKKLTYSLLFKLYTLSAKCKKVLANACKIRKNNRNFFLKLAKSLLLSL